ncbi:hypothetical protein C9J21_11895 [Photobacterium phosphoreum]|uniref:hypothetical protein n=1 Tax=Photobacterium phosphoreum TaxID=659 RepID=UPI000D16BA9B|nr:hypothetical protein [Photobacterium phosphoreum]PSU76012.1 hypothetical protein CTM67_15300 [Photobacterium phosphoreum]PSW32534.1 hypothetical protein C9J21_11895 [Photobacterium phosphoreum]
MAQVFDFDSIPTSVMNDQKTYSLTLKGLLVHARDILFSRSVSKPATRNISDLPLYIQKDIGLYR